MRKRFVATFVVFLLLGTATLFAGQQAKPSTKQPQAKSKAEYDAFVTFNSEHDFTKKTVEGEQFMKDYPASELTVPFVLPQMVIAYQQLNNYEKTVEYGEKILSADPNNVFALFMLSQVIPERIKDEDLDRQEKMDKTTQYAKKVLDLTGTMAKPDQFTDDQWKAQKAQLQGGAYSALGLVALHQKNYDEAVNQYKKSIEIYPKDPIAFYRLGLAYSFAKKSDEAIKALATSVAMNGPAQARSYLEQLYKAKNNGSLDGLDKVISDAGAGIKQ